MLSRIERSTNTARLRGALLAKASAFCAPRRSSISLGESVLVSSMVSKMDVWSALEYETEREKRAEELGLAVARDAEEEMVACAPSLEK